MKTTIKIGNQQFSSYEEYERVYIKKWESLHPNINADLNWVRQDWEYRKNKRLCS